MNFSSEHDGGLVGSAGAVSKPRSRHGGQGAEPRRWGDSGDFTVSGYELSVFFCAIWLEMISRSSVNVEKLSATFKVVLWNLFNVKCFDRIGIYVER